MKVIDTEKDYKTALVELESLIDIDPDPGTPEADRLGVLALLVEQYESKRFPIPLPDPLTAIYFRMEQQGLSQSDLVPYIGSRSKVSEVLSGKRSLSLSMIRALHFGLGIPAAVLLQNRPESFPQEDIEWDMYPIREMISRGWIKAEGKASDHIHLLKSFFARVDPLPAMTTAFLKKDHIRSERTMDHHALYAWRVWILIRAKEMELRRKYQPGTINMDFLRNLARLSTHAKGPLHAIEFLSEHGIAVINEPVLPRMYIDGAAMMTSQGEPVVGLTLRRDRIDNFWFVLLHELVHIWRHISDPSNLFFDDVESQSTDKKEHEADELAAEALIPKNEWDRSPAKFVKSPVAAKRLADKLGIHPAIAVGRMRFERKDYKILPKMVGQGEIKSLFGITARG